MPTRSPLFLDAIAQDPTGPSVLGKRLPLGSLLCGAALLFAAPIVLGLGLTLGRGYGQRAAPPTRPVDAVFLPRSAVLNPDAQRCHLIERHIDLLRAQEQLARCPRQRAFLQRQIAAFTYELETGGDRKGCQPYTRLAPLRLGGTAATGRAAPLVRSE